MPTLALAYLRDRAVTTLLNILLLALAVAALVMLLAVSQQVGNRFERDSRGIDLVVGAKGSPLQLILSSVYQLDQPTGNIPLSSMDLLRRDPSVARVIPLALGDNFQGYRIVGTEPGFITLHEGRLASGRMAAAPRQAVVGATVAAETGMRVGQRFLGSHGLGGDEAESEHEHVPFTAVGVLAPTGSVLDRLIIVSVADVWDAHGIEHGHAGEGAAGHEAHEPGHDHHEAPAALAAEAELKPELTALLVTYRNAFGAVRVPSLINRQTELQAAVPAVETARLLQLLGVGVDGARLFAWLLAGVGGLSIFVALLAAARAREGDLALLRIMGATRGQVVGTIVAEALLTALAGALLGLLLGHALLAAAAGSFDSLREIGLQPWRIAEGESAIVLAVIGIGVVAALIPALRVFRTDLATTLARAA